jgi:trigger factor
MNVEVTRLPESKVALKVELTPQEVDGAFDRTYKQLVQRVTIPGFRKGKAPRAVVERLVGHEFFVHEATDDAVEWGYRKAIEQAGLTPIDQAQIGGDEHSHAEPGEPFQFEATVSVRPEVTLPDYHTLKVTREQEPVADQDVDDLLEDLRQRQSTLEPVTRPAQPNDVVTINITGRSEGNEVLQQEDAQYEIRPPENDDDPTLPGLSKHLVGTTPGQIVETVIDLPETYYNAEIAGKPLSLRLIVKDVKAPVLPALDDDFASSISASETLEALRVALRENLEAERRAQADEKLVQSAVDEVVNRTFVDIPPIMIEDELDRMVDDMRQMFESNRLSFETYLEQVGQTEEEIRERARDDAIKNVKTSLVLSAVADAEGIDVPKREVDAALEEVFRTTTMTERERRQVRTSNAVRSNIRNRIRRQRAIRHLVEVMSGEEDVSDDAAEALADQTASAADSAQETMAVEAGS